MYVTAVIKLKIGDRAEFRECYNNWNDAITDVLEGIEADLSVPTSSIPAGIEVASVVVTEGKPCKA